MLRKTKTAIAALALAAMTLISLAFVASPAQAATNSYTPQGVCGSGYSIVAHTALTSLSSNRTTATVYLLKKGGWRCAVTIKSSATAGNKNWIYTAIGDNSDVKKSEGGHFKYYAGPKKLYVGTGKYDCGVAHGGYDNGPYTMETSTVCK